MHSEHTLDEKYEFTGKAKRNIGIVAVVGIIAVAIGIYMLKNGGGHHEGAEVVEEAGHHGFDWMTRVWADLWINNMYFFGISIIGVFFLALQYVAQAGWSAGLKRVFEPFGYWLPIAFVLILGGFYFGGHHIFHWTHETLYIEFLEDGTPNPEYDEVIAGKEGYLNTFGFITRMVIYFGFWFGLFLRLRKRSLAEDLEGGDKYWTKMIGVSAFFIVFFGYSSSMASWDWIMSIDPHWYSTLFGWYVFSSWFVSGLAAMTLLIIYLRKQGYLKIINANHMHNMGLFMWGFSIFWTYLWFSQFLLIYYANISEETIYFIERISSDYYFPIMMFVLIMNFFLPFFLLMTRESKRQTIFLQIVAIIILVGHWFDFYLMVTPGMLKENGNLGLLEIGTTLIYGSVFVYVILSNLAKNPLIAKNHPMMEESIHHQL